MVKKHLIAINDITEEEEFFKVSDLEKLLTPLSSGRRRLEKEFLEWCKDTTAEGIITTNRPMNVIEWYSEYLKKQLGIKDE